MIVQVTEEIVISATRSGRRKCDIERSFPDWVTSNLYISEVRLFNRD